MLRVISVTQAGILIITQMIGIIGIKGPVQLASQLLKNKMVFHKYILVLQQLAEENQVFQDKVLEDLSPHHQLNLLNLYNTVHRYLI